MIPDEQVRCPRIKRVSAGAREILGVGPLGVNPRAILIGWQKHGVVPVGDAAAPEGSHEHVEKARGGGVAVITVVSHVGDVCIVTCVIR